MAVKKPVKSVKKAASKLMSKPKFDDGRGGMSPEDPNRPGNVPYRLKNTPTAQKEYREIKLKQEKKKKREMFARQTKKR